MLVVVGGATLLFSMLGATLCARLSLAFEMLGVTLEMSSVSLLIVEIKSLINKVRVGEFAIY